jgi:predicted Rossmann fold flavoprotein
MMKKINELSGISFEANVSLEFNNTPRSKNKKINFTENILITHKGMSGPAILQISSYWQRGDILKITIEPNIKIEELIQKNTNSTKELKKLLSEVLSSRFAEFICDYIKINKSINQLSNKDKERIIEVFDCFKVTPIDTEGYIKAEVTIGGVDTNELNQKTMESKIVSGLYFIGEAVDVTGWLGGYNFQWAWTSGYVSGKSI